MPKATCSVDGCETEARCRGWCEKHYNRWLHHRNLADPEPPPIRICSMDECDRRVVARGWCSKHYLRWVKYQDPTYVAPLGRPPKTPALPNRYPLRDVICRKCEKVFRTRHGRVCGHCGYLAQKKTCACGNSISPTATACNKCSKGRGEKNANWKGGRFESYGYVRVRTPGHPLAKAGSGYVAEHTLVMEAALGRYLFPGENVHHRNGVRNDNRISNLELWLTGQPAGQRAVDLLDWAREIIATYEPIEPILRPTPAKRRRSAPPENQGSLL